MGGMKGDLDDLDFDDELESKSKQEDDDSPEMDLDDDVFEDGEEEDDGEKSHKSKNGKRGDDDDSPQFDREKYYASKEKLVQLSGMIRPKERSKEGKVTSLEFKTADKIYLVVMDEMGKKLLASCFQELLITGVVSRLSEKEFSLAIKTYI